MRCYLFDIDGTLADITHRLHHIEKAPKDWPAFFAACMDDKPIEHILGLARMLYAPTLIHIVYVSGRSDECMDETVTWLRRHRAPIGPLYMRKAGDHKPDHELKVELLAQLRADGYEPIMAFDDRTAVVKAWRAAGIPCAQVAEGEF